MAVVQWIDLPPDMIRLIAKFLSSDVDTIRLRSVCSYWRSLTRRRYRPSPFPLQVPPLLIDRASADPNGFRFFLCHTTVYRLSPPEFGPCAGDPTDGFLLRVSEVRPNTFRLMPLLRPGIPEFGPDLAPKRVNLLDFRVSEIYKSYVVECVGVGPFQIKVNVIWNFDADCAFVVVVLYKGVLHRWKFGDQAWFAIDSGNHKLNQLFLYDGKCYAIGDQGLVLLVDSKFKVTVVPSLPRLPVYPHKASYFYLVGYKSELYVLSLSFDFGKGDKEAAIQVKIFKKGNRVWEQIKCLGDKMFIFCYDAIIGFSSKDFHVCKGNCIYLYPDRLPSYGRHGNKIAYAEYDLDEDRTLFRNWGEEAHSVICRPPPKWLLFS